MYVTYTRIYGWSDYGGESSYQPGYRLENMMWMTLLVYDYIIPGENLRDTGYLLEEKGYEVRVLDLINMEKSHCYNPFVYLQNDNDVQKLVTNLFKSTTPKGSQAQDP